MFGTLLNSKIYDIYNICKTYDIAFKICENKYFWERKFKHDNLPIFFQQNTLEDWIDEYVSVEDAIIDSGDTLKISLIEKARDISIDILFPNDGTIIVSFSDVTYNYDTWILPKELISLVLDKLDKLDKKDYNIYPVQFKFVPNSDKYKLIYDLSYEENDIQDIEVFIDELTLQEVKDILVKSIYKDEFDITDSMDTNYLFNDRDLFHVDITNSKYYNMIKNSRLGMRDTFEYLRK